MIKIDKGEAPAFLRDLKKKGLGETTVIMGGLLNENMKGE